MRQRGVLSCVIISFSNMLTAHKVVKEINSLFPLPNLMSATFVCPRIRYHTSHFSFEQFHASLSADNASEDERIDLFSLYKQFQNLSNTLKIPHDKKLRFNLNR